MKKNVLFVSSEAVPFIKTGGLADVAGSLPKYSIRNTMMCVSCCQSICAFRKNGAAR